VGCISHMRVFRGEVPYAPLSVLAAHVAQTCDLLSRFDALGNYRQLQVVRQSHDRAYDLRARRARSRKKASIQLECGPRETLHAPVRDANRAPIAVNRLLPVHLFVEYALTVAPLGFSPVQRSIGIA